MALFLKPVTAPVGNIVSLEEVKDQLRIEHNEHDVLLNSYIKVAQQQAEMKTGRALLTQTWDWLLDGFTSWWLEVPLSPLQSVTHIKYYDESNAQQTWLSTNYEIDAASMRPRISPVNGQSYPVTYNRQQAIEIRLVVGFGTVPESIKLWLTAAVGEMYKTPEITVERQNVGESLSSFMDGLLDFYRMPKV